MTNPHTPDARKRLRTVAANIGDLPATCITGNQLAALIDHLTRERDEAREAARWKAACKSDDPAKLFHEMASEYVQTRDWNKGLMAQTETLLNQRDELRSLVERATPWLTGYRDQFAKSPDKVWASKELDQWLSDARRVMGKEANRE